MTNSVRVYVGSLIFLGAAAAFVVYLVDPAPNSTLFQGAVCFAALSAACELLAYKKAAPSESGSIAFLPMLASVVIAPHWLTVACLAVAGCIIESHRNRKAPIKALFNIS